MAQTSARTRRATARSASLILATLASLISAACETGTGPVDGRPELAMNTLAIQVAGASLSFSTTVTARGGFQHVTQNVPSIAARDGMYIYAEPEGLAFALSVPGIPDVGESAMGRWDPRAVYLREQGELRADPQMFERARPILNVARTPSIAFGDHRAAVLGEYASMTGGILSIDEISVPDRRALPGLEATESGHVRGRVTFRAARDSLLTEPGTPFSADTIDVVIDFLVGLENWPDGSANIHFTDGSLSGLPPLAVVGSATDWMWDTDPAKQLVIGLGGIAYDNGDVLTLWLGTQLTGPGSADIDVMDTARGIGPEAWPDHFVAGMYVDRDGEVRLFRSMGGAIQLHDYEPSTNTRWGEARGTIDVELSVQGGGTYEQVTVAISFHVPLGYFVNYCVHTCPAAARLPVGAGADLRLRAPAS
jgi:hypothetical protein